MASSSKALSGLDPLKDLLGDVIARLEALEAKAGVSAPSAVPRSPVPVKPTLHAPGGVGEAESVKAYDAYVKSDVVPFAKSCDDLGGLQNMGTLVSNAWEGIRTVIVLASRAKDPQEDLHQALTPYLTQTQDAVKQIRELKLDRDWDRHYKAVVEMLSCLSWVYCTAPKQLPAPFVKETLGSAEFWTNRIRKDYKGKDDQQIAFCDNLKTTLTGLAEYIESYHKTGLTFNPKGVSLAEAGVRLSDEPPQETDIKSPRPRNPALGNAVGGNVAGLIGELTKRKTSDGSSAATGLKHVTKDQQTWRKEFKKPDASAPPSVPSLDEKKEKKVVKKTKPKALPIFEYQDRGFKWVIENHTKDTVMKEISKDGILTVEISDVKQQVYMYNCEGITVKVVGKFKSLILDACTKCSVVYENVISGADVVNCKRIQLQVTGVCPAFTVDKTVGCLIWLSEESKSISTFTASLSSEMNISFPDGDDQKELPIPEQFVHKLSNGTVTSEVSDLYH